MDAWINWLNLRARYYEPVVGRFLTRDAYAGEVDEPALVYELRRIIEKEYQYNKSEMKKEQYKKVFARYNGTGRE